MYEDAANEAERLGDSESLAYIVNNVGLCCLHMGMLDRAEQCFDKARAMFEELGLDVAVQQARGNSVKALVKRGKYNEGISELYKIRAILLGLGMKIPAAMVAIDIVDLLFLAGRSGDIANLCQEMFATFTEAKLTKNALKALAFLAELARCQQIDIEHVAYVRGFLESLDADPERPFIEPVN